MSKELATESELEKVSVPNQRRLLHISNNDSPGAYYVAISHEELDHLVGSLMAMLDIVGNQEQARALKDATKVKVRSWLDDYYASAGYDKWEGIQGWAVPNVVQIKD